MPVDERNTMDGKAVVRIAAPFISYGVIWSSDRLMAAGYKAATGEVAPTPEDTRDPLVRVLVYTTATAVVATVLRVAVSRILASAVGDGGDGDDLA
ncbi:MAG: DUF4235 domain-containing protein [Actinobacteria bacterium]|nr:DUF4235 domain-containing protein [Actinomycetota bacterium]